MNNAFNNGVEGTGSGSYPYTHNLRYTYDADKPSGQRIDSLHICNREGDWQLIEHDRLYTGTSSAYTMKGKEGYDAIINMRKHGTVTSFSMADCFVEFLQVNNDRFQHTSSVLSRSKQNLR